ncbi:hypothetical protein EOS_28420 [Caballeronia mineralivorans PML1(12)]|uniref:Uncharacterized protein n=1 Tax=Caballeronia mineralivorans PML1(12) TaxID=908627 RepID=A0A0J1FSZ5_9BURK|nr:hypothetical protein EOS_28420 [Caballeronia mineralivorans PML1(12)]
MIGGLLAAAWALHQGQRRDAGRDMTWGVAQNALRLESVTHERHASRGVRSSHKALRTGQETGF